MSELVTDIPGGQASWYDAKTLTPRRERMLQVEGMPMRSVIARLEEFGMDADLTEEELTKMLSLNELSVIVFLKSWTLKNDDGSDRPIPATKDEVLDLDRPLYQALLESAAEIFKGAAVDGFSVDAVEDMDSPTGDLGV